MFLHLELIVLLRTIQKLALQLTFKTMTFSVYSAYVNLAALRKKAIDQPWLLSYPSRAKF
jgi:hypothetical protein